MSRTSKRARDGARDASPVLMKQAKRQVKRFKGATFPAKVTALSPVMKLINRFLMGPNSAIMDAALTSHVSWLNQLLGRFKCDVSRWLVAAAVKGHRNVVNRLLVPPRNWKEPPNTVIARAAVVAGGAGHLEMTALLLNQNELNVTSLRNDIERNYAHTTARTVLSTAAANGHQNVVQYMVQRAHDE
ncbi:Ankyrin repeats (3 copies) [Phytophthora infestans]|uniref:Ankyrin repeats (3 copies) n=1 Tax=Phytophthora infestans TaxID=4787 RepID=A0A833WQ47_PHYIN|nr:Ankyrin repeats (3 copies) [Phytophthora infestans]KAF4138790.1 Ankyrin repeats domain-containing protein [Phytophthora infestans]